MRAEQQRILDAITATIADGGWGWDTREIAANLLGVPRYVAAGHLLQMKRRGVLVRERVRCIPPPDVVVWRLP